MYKKDKPTLVEKLKNKFPFEPTQGQAVFLEKIVDFVSVPKNDQILVLRGYAGTGKTTLLSCLLPVLQGEGIRSVLLAPTGRAAKVMAGYTKRQAFTIHKQIYYPSKNKSGGISFTMKTNKHHNTLFFVDEASMISHEGDQSKLFGSGDSLLSDLLEYAAEGNNCKLVFIGDTAQLPPVKLDESPALEPDILSRIAMKTVVLHTLEEVTRQQQHSGILINATALRNFVNEFVFEPFQFDLQRPDLVRLQEVDEVQDAIADAYREGTEQTIFIVRSNKRANQYNAQLRSRILGRESDISIGDQLMCVRNNYTWVSPDSDIGFIANGETFEVLNIFGYKNLYGFKFVKVKVHFLDYPDFPATELMLLLDTLTSESPALTYDESNRLYQEVAKDYADLPKFRQHLKIKANPYFNAVQVKYAYAVTCHKSQGGQWNHVFVEQPYLPNGADVDFYRWLYTAITRAKKKVYLIGFGKDFFED